MDKNSILAFIKTKIHAVISTCGKSGIPEAALIGFGETDDFELIFGTNTSTRKYKNLHENSRVALVIGLGENNVTVQCEGVATELNPTDWEQYLSFYHRKVPSAVAFKNQPGQTYFKVTPTWMRYSDLSGSEAQIFEFTF